MKITDLKVEGFGVWKGLALRDFSDRLTVLFGRNEAGKTTLMEFVRTVLYGFSAGRSERYLPPLGGGRGGGVLGVTSSNGKFQIQRFADDGAAAGPGELDVVAADGTVHGQHLLNVLLAGIDEPIYSNVFAVGLRELQELGTLNDTEAARQLYDLSSGLDRISLTEVMRELAISRGRILASDESRSQVVELMDQRDRLLTQLEQHRAGTKHWVQLAERRETVDSEVKRTREEIGRLEQQTRILEIARLVRDKWQQRSRVEQQLAELGPLCPLPAGSIDRLDRLNSQIARRRARCEQIKLQWGKLRQEALDLPLNSALRRHAARIEALAEQQPWIESMEGQIEQLQSEIRLMESELALVQQPLGLTGQDQSPIPANLSQRTLAPLRSPARNMRDQQRRLHEARRDVLAHRQQAEQQNDQLQAALTARGQADLLTAIEQAGNLVSQLRQRLHLDQRHEQLKRQQEELEEQSNQLLQRQVLPVWALAALGSVFVLGVMLILAGLFGNVLAVSSSVGWSLALLGLCGTATAVGAKILLERSAAARLTVCNRQTELVGIQIEQATQDRRAMDAELPRGGGPLVSRRQAAESDLAGLEELLPLDTQQQAARREVEAAQRRADQARSSLAQARSRWREALRTAGLPDSLSPKQVRLFVDRGQKLAQLTGQIQLRREELSQRHNELSTFADRITQITADVGVTRPTDSPLGQLRQLVQQLHQQKQLFQRRHVLARKARILRRQHAKIARGAQRLNRRRQTLLADTDVPDEQQFRQLAQQIRQAESFRKDHDALGREITTVIGDVCSEKTIQRQLDRQADEGPDKPVEQHRARLAELEDRHGQHCQQQGRLAEQMLALAEDRRGAEARLALGCVEQQLVAMLQKWQVLTVTELLLESVRKVYEKHRQPQVLSEASGYLARMTEGRYTRVWTPLGEDVLRVDDAQGNPLPLEVLSSGAREQVFLSLRLALAAWYSRRGAMLPLVLDDVLVNFDMGRAKATAQVLRDFAKSGHQLLIFTCHEHIMKLFKTLRVAVRQLPAHSETEDNAQETEPELQAQSKAKPKRKRKTTKAEPVPVAEVEDDQPPPIEDEEEGDSQYEDEEPEEEDTDEEQWEEEDEEEDVEDEYEEDEDWDEEDEAAAA